MSSISRARSPASASVDAGPPTTCGANTGRFAQAATKLQGQPAIEFPELRRNFSEASPHRMSIDLGEQIRQSLRAARLIFAFQPVVDGRTGSVADYECLLRMRGAAGGNQLVAGVFMPVVEEIGMTRLVDHYVLDLAIRELALDPSVALALNISGRTATDRSWRDSLVRRLAGRSIRWPAG